MVSAQKKLVSRLGKSLSHKKMYKDMPPICHYTPDAEGSRQMESVPKLQYSKYACTHRVSASRQFLYFVHCAKQRLRACQEYQYHQHQPATSNPLTRQRGQGSLKSGSHYLKHALPLITLSAVGPSLLDMTHSAQIKNVKGCHLCNLQ